MISAVDQRSSEGIYSGFFVQSPTGGANNGVYAYLEWTDSTPEADRPKLYEQLVESGELEKDLVEPASKTFSTGVKIFAYSALGLGLVLIVLILYAMIFAYR